MPEIDQIFLETTNKCCGSCTTCLNRVMKRERGVMPFKDFKKCIDEIVKDRLCNMVHLYGFGEPYLTPSYLDYCNYAIPRLNEAKISSTIITNGMVVTKIPKGVTNFIISFNAGRKETYEKITGLDFHRTYDNIVRLYAEIQFRRAKKVEIHMLVFEDNKDEIDDFIKLFEIFGDLVSLRIGYKYDNQRGLIEDKTLKEYKDDKRIPCHYIKDVMNITWNGDVSLCPHDADNELIYGNAFEESIMDIWERGNGYKVKYRKIYHNLCKNCNYNITTKDKFVMHKYEELER